MIGDHIGGMAAFDDANIHGAWAKFAALRQGHSPQALQRDDELINGGIAEVGIGRVRQASTRDYFHAQRAFGSRGDAIFRRLSVDQEAARLRAKFARLPVGDMRALAIALFAHQKKQAHRKLGAKALGGGNLRRDNSLGIA